MIKIQSDQIKIYSSTAQFPHMQQRKAKFSSYPPGSVMEHTQSSATGSDSGFYQLGILQRHQRCSVVPVTEFHFL